MNKNDASFGFEEFIEEENVSAPEENTAEQPAAEEENAEETPGEIDVQKAAVELLAQENIKMKSDLENLKKEVAEKSELAKKSEQEKEVFSKDLETAKKELEEARQELRNLQKLVFDEQERNPNALALLDRDVEVPDRFAGETRDFVLEVVKEARDKAEADGRIRLAQVLEGVLASNEPNGTLAGKREELNKLFAANSYLLSGEVIAFLEKESIAYKTAKGYLMPLEIIKREF